MPLPVVGGVLQALLIFRNYGLRVGKESFACDAQPALLLKLSLIHI